MWKKAIIPFLKKILLLLFYCFSFCYKYCCYNCCWFIFCYEYCCCLFHKKDSNEFLDENKKNDDNIYQSGLIQNISSIEPEINNNQNSNIENKIQLTTKISCLTKTFNSLYKKSLIAVNDLYL